MYPLPSCCILAGHTPLVTSLWAVIHGLTKNKAAADDSGSRNGDDNCGTLHHQLRRSHNWPEQSLSEGREPMGDSCAREFLVLCTKKSQTRRGGLA